MNKGQGFEKRRIIGVFLFVLALTVFMMFAVSMRVEAKTYDCSPEGILYDADGDSKPDEFKGEGVSFDKSTKTLTLSGCTFDGTLAFSGVSNADNNTQEVTHYTIELSSGTRSVINSLKLNSAVILTIKGDGELYLGLSEEQAGDQNTGASLEFQQDPKTLAPELIIEGGTVTIDGSQYGYAVKEEGCLYIRSGAKQVTLIKGKSGLILDGEEYGIPRIFSDYPCQAEYISGKKVILSPNGTRNGRSDKGVNDTSLIENDYAQYSRLVFNPKYTAAWQNDDPAGSVFSALKLRPSKVAKKAIRLKWDKVKNAKKYVLYGNYCGKKNKNVKLKTFNASKKSYKVENIVQNGKKVKLKAGNYYKFLMVALDKNGKVLTTSKTVYCTTTGGKAGNPKKVTTKAAAKKNKIKLKVKKTYKLGAKAVAASKKLKVKKYRAIKYESTNKKIASVNKKGKITAKKAGTCYVYAYAQNGLFAKIKVIVKK